MMAAHSDDLDFRRSGAVAGSILPEPKYDLSGDTFSMFDVYNGSTGKDCSTQQENGKPHSSLPGSRQKNRRPWPR